MTEDFVWFVGIDWATARHQVCVIGGDGGGPEQREIEHTAAGVHGFVEWLQTRTGNAATHTAVRFEALLIVSSAFSSRC